MPLSTEIFQEGFRLPPVHLERGGRPVGEVRALFLANSRVPVEREGDLAAQCAALRLGASRLVELAIATGGPRALAHQMVALQRYSARLMASVLRCIPRGIHRASDVLDDDGLGHSALRIQVAISVRRGIAHVDFAGSSPQTRGPLNANLAVTRSAVLYVFAALAREAIPPNEGMARPLRITAPEGSIVNARFPAAVAGGNVETSQRIVDVVLRALARALPDRIPAASAGTMSNLAFGGVVGTQPFAYYETIAGGAGGGPTGPGTSAIHTHMTNTMNTPVEALEAYYPLRIRRYAIREGSGGRGRHPGGNGIVREIEFQVPADVTLIGDRRRTRPYGLAGGKPGRAGRDAIIRAGRTRVVAAKISTRVEAGERLRIETPGGGGHGTPGYFRRRR
jgi:N-methylhydantoinase B